jgi:hypothetical protein
MNKECNENDEIPKMTKKNIATFLYLSMCGKLRIPLILRTLIGNFWRRRSVCMRLSVSNGVQLVKCAASPAHCPGFRAFGIKERAEGTLIKMQECRCAFYQ